jgi:hypothetical protein
MTATIPVPAEIREYPNPTFMKKFKRYEPMVMDHSAIIVAKTCTRKYFYRIVLGFAPRARPQYFGFGSCYHKFREILERKWMDDPRPHPVKVIDQEFQMKCFAEAVSATRNLWKVLGMKDPIVGDKWDFMTEARLVESCAVAFKHWQKEKIQNRIEVIAIEQNFIVPLPDGSYRGGKKDQITRWNQKVWVRDWKTSSKEQNAYYTRTLDPNDQFMGYAYGAQHLCGEPVQGVLVEVLYNAKGTKSDPKKGPEIHQHISSRSQGQMQQWEKEQVTFNKQLNVAREDDVWPMEERSCPFCEYHSVCTRASESAQMAKLEAEFVVQPWNFLSREVDD